MRIAIVGAGISGLTAAYLLSREHEVTVFEAADRIGGHTNTVRVDTAEQTHHLDTGFIVFNDRNYPNFERLIGQLGVPWQESDMSFSVSDGLGRFEYSSASLNGLFARRSHLVSGAFYKMVAEVPRFQRAARELISTGQEDISLREWLTAQRFSRDFIERLIVPQASAVWSADPRQMWSFPALFLAQFFQNHGMLGLRGRPRWRTIRGGSSSYVGALTDAFANQIRVGTPIDEVQRNADHVQITPRGQGPERFDQVVIATHSDQALAMLTDASDSEEHLLRAIPYQQNEVVLHTDTRMLPSRPRAWASWNYHLRERPSERTLVTYHLNRLQALQSSSQFCVTLNLTDEIDPEKVLYRTTTAHPVYTPDGIKAQRRVQEISGPATRTHFAGAYWGWGFHEDGVVSGARVAATLGAKL